MRGQQHRAYWVCGYNMSNVIIKKFVLSVVFGHQSSTNIYASVTSDRILVIWLLNKEDNSHDPTRHHQTTYFLILSFWLRAPLWLELLTACKFKENHSMYVVRPTMLAVLLSVWRRCTMSSTKLWCPSVTRKMQNGGRTTTVLVCPPTGQRSRWTHTLSSQPY